jgi:hypothetical protein
MALFNIGSLGDFAVEAKPKIIRDFTFFHNVKTFDALNEVSRETPVDAFDIISSAEKREIDLKSIKLLPEFGSWLRKIFDPDYDVYFLAWSWDLSGQPVYSYPGTISQIDPQNLTFNLTPGISREFIGNGINLFPDRNVKGGIGVRIQLFVSKNDMRTIGNAITSAVDSINKSSLNQVLTSLIGLAGITGATFSTIWTAANDLAGIVGSILKGISDDYVDYFAGYYSAASVWQKKTEIYTGNSSEIKLDLL